jgi:hypothetical protein
MGMQKSFESINAITEKIMLKNFDLNGGRDMLLILTFSRHELMYVETA